MTSQNGIIERGLAANDPKLSIMDPALACTKTQPDWVNNLKKSDSHIIGTTVMKREDPDKKKEKAAWQSQPKLHKAVIDPRAKKEVEPTGAKKPAWSGVSLKKAEKK